MKKKIGNVFLILLGIVMLLYLLITAVLDLTNKEDLHMVHVDGAFAILELEHSINGLIPIGTDYYYVGVEEETLDAYLIKAPKNWLEKNFNSENMSLQAGGMQITALLKKVSDFDTARELSSRASQIEELQYPFGTEYCLDLGYKQMAIKKLILFVLSIIIIITGVSIFKKTNEVKPAVVKCWLVALIIWLVLLLGVFR